MTIAWADIFTGLAVLLIGSGIVGAFAFVTKLSAGQQAITKIVGDGFADVKVSHAKMCGSLDILCANLTAHADLDEERFKNVKDMLDAVPCKYDHK